MTSKAARGGAAAYHFTLAFDVRDCECDLQGIVNNAVYQQYLEHTRHTFLRSHGLQFAQLTRQGIHLVVTRAELDYKSPLRSGDAFIVGLTLERTSPVRFTFVQDIYRQPDKKLMLSSRFVCAAMDEGGRPIMPRVLDPLLEALRAPDRVI
jgi:acyl-CoA thioester hydrolase